MLSKKIRDNVSDAKKDARAIKNEAQAAYDNSRDNLENIAESAGRRLRHVIDDAGQSISDATDKVTTQIRRNPVQSSLIALGAGVFLGALLRR
jgi:ElaB/YqjD/DUF883 family membrane-anchored ribosome-binding protein